MDADTFNNWRKSSRSGGGDNCVEVGFAPGRHVGRPGREGPLPARSQATRLAALRGRAGRGGAAAGGDGCCRFHWMSTVEPWRSRTRAPCGPTAESTPSPQSSGSPDDRSRNPLGMSDQFRGWPVESTLRAAGQRVGPSQGSTGQDSGCPFRV